MCQGFRLPHHLKDVKFNDKKYIMIKQLPNDTIYDLISNGDLLPIHLGCHENTKKIAYKLLYMDSGLNINIMYFKNCMGKMIADISDFDNFNIYSKEIRTIIFNNMYKYDFDSDINKLEYINSYENQNMYGTEETVKSVKVEFKLIKNFIKNHTLTDDNKDYDYDYEFFYKMLIYPSLLKNELIPEYVIEFYLPKFSTIWNDIKDKYSYEFQKHINTKIALLNELNKNYIF